MTTKNAIIQSLKIALLKEKLKNIPRETVITVAEAFDTHGVLDFSGDSNIDNLKIKDCITEAISFFKTTSPDDDDDEVIFHHAERLVQCEGIECHTMVRDAIHVALRDDKKKEAVAS